MALLENKHVCLVSLYCPVFHFCFLFFFSPFDAALVTAVFKHSIEIMSCFLASDSDSFLFFFGVELKLCASYLFPCCQSEPLMDR